MNFFMGGLTKPNIDYISTEITNEVTNAKIWGISFPEYESRTSEDLIVQNDPPKGTRLYTAKSYKFSPSTTTDPGVDNFTDDNAGPFMIRECCTRYNETTGKQEVVSYEGDSTWDTDKVNTDYNRMIEFPLFYYCRPERYTFLVSDQPVKNFSPSPMHCRNGVIHNFVYISKYLLGTNYKSQTNQAIYSTTISNWYGNLSSQGLNILDYKIHFSISMLMYIKYAYLSNFYPVFGQKATTSYTTGVGDSILSKDGMASYRINTFGLEEYLAADSYSNIIFGLNLDNYYDSDTVDVTTDTTTTGNILIHDFGEKMICHPNIVDFRSLGDKSEYHRVLLKPKLNSLYYSSDNKAINTKELIYLNSYPYISIPDLTEDDTTINFNNNQELLNIFHLRAYNPKTKIIDANMVCSLYSSAQSYSPTYLIFKNSITSNCYARSYFNSN